jgi:hypothetical protein
LKFKFKKRFLTSIGLLCHLGSRYQRCLPAAGPLKGIL